MILSQAEAALSKGLILPIIWQLLVALSLILAVVDLLSQNIGSITNQLIGSMQNYSVIF